MCTNIIIYLFVILVVIENYFAIDSQTFNANERKINIVAFQDRKDCKIQDDQNILDNAHYFDFCGEKHMPPIESDYFNLRENILCIAYYEALYGLCEFYETGKSLDYFNHEEINNPGKICKFSNELYNKMNLDYSEKSEMVKWSKYIKKSLSDINTCQNLCIFMEKIDPKCPVVLNLVSLYNELKSTATASKTSKIGVDTESTSHLEQSSDALEINQKKESLSTVVLHKSSDTQKQDDQITKGVEPNNPTNTVTNEKSVKHSENLPSTKTNRIQVEEDGHPVPPEPPLPPDSHSKVTPSSSTLQPQQEPQPKESVKAQIPNMLDRQDDLEPDGIEMGQEGLPPSSEREGTFMEEDTKPFGGEKFNDMGSDPAKSAGQINTNDQEMDIQPGGGEYIRDNFKETEDSNFFAYFLIMTGVCIGAYVLFHNRNKLVALALEGRKGRSARARGGGRHSSASYSKLHSNLEEAIASNASAPSATNVLY